MYYCFIVVFIFLIKISVQMPRPGFQGTTTIKCKSFKINAYYFHLMKCVVMIFWNKTIFVSQIFGDKLKLKIPQFVGEKFITENGNFQRNWNDFSTRDMSITWPSCASGWSLHCFGKYALEMLTNCNCKRPAIKLDCTLEEGEGKPEEEEEGNPDQDKPDIR